MFEEKIKKYVQNRLEISFLNMLSKILYDTKRKCKKSGDTILLSLGGEGVLRDIYGSHSY
jgi:hypothetical protein